jgi:hypothetical protein
LTFSLSHMVQSEAILGRILASWQTWLRVKNPSIDGVNWSFILQIWWHWATWKWVWWLVIWKILLNQKADEVREGVIIARRRLGWTIFAFQRWNGKAENP